jgi:hypothetical protein
MGRGFKEITTDRRLLAGGDLDPRKIEMFYMVCYDIDKFREFLFNSSFFEKFEVDEKRREAMKQDDVELLKFGYDWLKFALFGDSTMRIKGEVRSAKARELAQEDKKQT